MEIDVYYPAIILAIIASLAISSIWYSPLTLYKTWLRLSGVSEITYKKGFLRAMIFGVAGVTLKAYILYHLIAITHYAFNNSWLGDSLTTAFWVWLGFVAATIFSVDAYACRNKKLSMLESGHQLVSILSMALVIGLFKG